MPSTSIKHTIDLCDIPVLDNRKEFHSLPSKRKNKAWKKQMLDHVLTHNQSMVIQAGVPNGR